MLQKMELQQLQQLCLGEIKSYKDKALKRKLELEAAKARGGADWTPALQNELNDIAILLVDIDDVIEEKAAAKPNYKVKPGTEKMVHLSLVHGRRFNPNTGKEESAPFIQLFTFSEWQIFKKNYVNLGYTIMAVMHDPYGDAKKLVANY